MMVASLVGPDDADERAEVDEMIGDDAVERGDDRGVAKIDVARVSIDGLGVQNVRGRLLDVGLPLLEWLGWRSLCCAERCLALIFGLVVGLRRLVGGERRLGLVELRLILVALDAEELRSLRDRGAVVIIDRFAGSPGRARPDPRS